MRKSFGKLKNDTEVWEFTISNNSGLSLRVINLGGIITNLSYPFQSGLVNTVLGFSTIEKYLPNPSYLGAIVGRFANRIKNGNFSILDKRFQLAKNNGSNHLHGGLYGFDQKFWEIEELQFESFPSIKLNYESLAGEEGYPGEVRIEVIYQLRNNQLRIIFKANTTEPTPINLTQHSYFNLSGSFSAISDHLLQINSQRFAPVDETQIPNAGLVKVDNTPFNFKELKRIQECLNQKHAQLSIGNGLDHSFEVNQTIHHPIAKLIHPISKRGMHIYTNQPALHVYTGNHLKQMDIPTHAGICFEAQAFPDSVNQPQFGNPILLPGQEYYHETIFEFFDA